MSVNANQFPQVYQDLGIDINDLGCIMLDTEPLQVDDIIPEEDLYYSPTMKYAQGIVSQAVPHVTLLYGLMSSGQAMKKHVDAVLQGWQLSEVQIGQVTYFESVSEDEPYYCVVAELVMTPALLEGNGRLRMLPHLDTFSQYKAHVTLAYINQDEAKRDEYIAKLNERFALRKVNVVGLNYGS